MLALWRGLIWTLGSLSVAVLLAGAYDAKLMPLLQTVLTTYDRIVSDALAPLAPWVAALLPALSATIGAGNALLPHWSHVFLVATLHMLPQADASYGVGGMRAAVLWALQAIGALIAGAFIAACAGSLPFLVSGSEGDWVVALFVAAAFFVAFLNDPETPEDESEVPNARRDEAEHRSLLATSRGAFAMAVFLALVFLVMVGLTLSFIGRAEGETLFVALFALAVIFLLVRLFGRLWNRAVDNDDWFDQGLLIGLARAALILGALAIGAFFEPGQRGLGGRILVLAGGGVVFALFYAGRRAVDRLFGREAHDPPHTPALGVFLLGGAAILIANFFAS